MALVVFDRVKETSNSTGTGTIVLDGAQTGYQSFAVVGNANTTYYTIAGQTTGQWEVGIGTYYTANTSLARTTILASSAANAAVTFSAGAKDVFVTYPAEKSVNIDATGNVSSYKYLGGSIDNITIGATTANTGAFTSLTASSTASFGTSAYFYGTAPGLTLGSANVSTGSCAIEVGTGRTGNGYAYTDFVGDATYTDFGFRIIRGNTGPNTTSQLIHRGTGAVYLTAQDAGNVIFSTTNIERVRVVSGGNVGIGNTNPQSLLTVAGQIESTSAGYKFPDGTTQTTAASGIAAAGNSSIGVFNTNITANATISTGTNGLSIGPVTTANGVTVTVGANATWLTL